MRVCGCSNTSLSNHVRSIRSEHYRKGSRTRIQGSGHMRKHTQEMLKSPRRLSVIHKCSAADVSLMKTADAQFPASGNWPVDDGRGMTVISRYPLSCLKTKGKHADNIRPACKNHFTPTPRSVAIEYTHQWHHVVLGKINWQTREAL